MVRIVTAGPEDAGMLACAEPGVFAGPVGPARAAEFLARPGHVLCLAVDGARVVGQGMGLVLHYPDRPEQFWLNELTVAPDWRGRGIGKLLAGRLLDEGRARGGPVIWVDADPGNAAAVAIYTSLGGARSGDLTVFEWRAPE